MRKAIATVAGIVTGTAMALAVTANLLLSLGSGHLAQASAPEGDAGIVAIPASYASGEPFYVTVAAKPTDPSGGGAWLALRVASGSAGVPVSKVVYDHKYREFRVDGQQDSGSFTGVDKEVRFIAEGSGAEMAGDGSLHVTWKLTLEPGAGHANVWVTAQDGPQGAPLAITQRASIEQ